jgi:hypothetical protein
MRIKWTKFLRPNLTLEVRDATSNLAGASEMSEITLREAFLYALGYFEVWDEVSPEERMGLLPGWQEDEEHPRCRIVATGRELIKAIPVPSPSPRRGSDKLRPPALFVPRVPAVPTSRELSAMKSDLVSAPSSQSFAERRAVAVANWIGDALATDTIVAEGRCLFIPQDGSHSFYLDGYCRLDTMSYNSWRIDFAASSIEITVHLYSAPGYPDTFLGKIWYENVVVSYDRFFGLLKETRGPRLLPEIDFDPLPAHSAVRCTIQFEGECVKIPLTRQEGFHRTLMAITLLLKWPNQGISPQLINFLTRRAVKVKDKSGMPLEGNMKLGEEVTNLASGFYEGAISLAEAHNALARLLCPSEGEDVYNWLQRPSSPEGAQRRNPTKRYSNRRDYIRKNFNEVLAYVEGHGGQKTAAYLRDRLDFGQHVFTFRPNKPASAPPIGG